MGAVEIEKGEIKGQVDFLDREKIEGSVSDNGAITLRWEGDGDEELILEQSQAPSFSQPVERYRGRDPGSVLTGLEEGVHYFRIGRGDGSWSDPLKVTVEFFPQDRLVLLLVLGGIVVLSTGFTIIFGYWQNRRKERAST